MRNPETSFIESIHRLMPSVDELHHEKMANPYRGGTADVWYSHRRDLWIEYKFIEVPKREGTSIDFIGGKKPTISQLQQDWIEHRVAEGRNVWVVIGCKAGGVVIRDLSWAQPWSAKDFTNALLSRQAIAASIVDFVGRP